MLRPQDPRNLLVCGLMIMGFHFMLVKSLKRTDILRYVLYVQYFAHQMIGFSDRAPISVKEASWISHRTYIGRMRCRGACLVKSVFFLVGTAWVWSGVVAVVVLFQPAPAQEVVSSFYQGATTRSVLRHSSLHLSCSPRIPQR